MSGNYSLYTIPEDELPKQMVLQDIAIRSEILVEFSTKYSSLYQELSGKHGGDLPDTEEAGHIVVMALRGDGIQTEYQIHRESYNQSNKGVENLRIFSRNLLGMITRSELLNNLDERIRQQNT